MFPLQKKKKKATPSSQNPQKKIIKVYLFLESSAVIIYQTMNAPERFELFTLGANQKK